MSGPVIDDHRGRRLAIGTWSPDYGAPVPAEAPVGDPDQATPAAVDVTVERTAEDWSPIPAHGDRAGVVQFVDGVRRIDARLWLTVDGVTGPGIAASYAAGVVCCDEDASVRGCEIRRTAVVAHPEPVAIPVPGLGTYRPRSVEDPSDAALTQALQEDMAALEQAVAGAQAAADLTVVDGPLRVRPAGPDTVGYIKRHHTVYLSGRCADVVAALRPGERTPVFRISSGRWSKLSWYLRLPGDVDHPWEAVARLEVVGDVHVAAAARIADRSAATLPRFASEPYKDARAPQNLHPIAALERALRRRLGDPALVERALRRAARPLG